MPIMRLYEVVTMYALVFYMCIPLDTLDTSNHYFELLSKLNSYMNFKHRQRLSRFK